MRNLYKIILGLALIVVLLVGIAVLRRGASGDLYNAPYGSDRLQKFDFTIPAQESGTLIVVVHGGAWVAGDKGYMAGVAKYLNGQGHAVINMNYRLAPKWKYDAQLKDIALVINYAKSHRSELKLGENFRTVLLGHSAGAHLSEMYGLKESKYGTENTGKIIALAGPSDLVNIAQTNITNLLASLVLDSSTTKAEASPINNIESGDKTKFLLIVGSEDELIDESQITSFEAALREKNVSAESFIVQGRTHNTIYSEIPKGDAVAQRILSFLKSD